MVLGPDAKSSAPEVEVDIKSLHAKIGELVLENDFLERALARRAFQRKAMIDRHHKLALTKQAALLGISRGSVYYEPAPVSAADLALMRRLDELHLEFPFAVLQSVTPYS